MRADGHTAWGWAAPWAIAVGAVVSAALVLYATRRVGSPPLLQVLFAGWVLAPFGLLAVGLARSARWPAPVRATAGTVSVIVAVASVMAYGVAAVGPWRPKAPVFVLGPPITSVLAVIAVMMTALGARRR